MSLTFLGALNRGVSWSDGHPFSRWRRYWYVIVPHGLDGAFSRSRVSHYWVSRSEVSSVWLRKTRSRMVDHRWSWGVET